MVERISNQRSNPFVLSVLLFLACIPSAGALLLNVYGWLSMRTAFLVLALPCGLVLLWIGWLRRGDFWKGLSETIQLGFFAGVVSTLAYDIVRIPFHLAGLRVFAPINIYGVWLADASASTPYTYLLGWSYHFYNGIAFAIMYALFMRGRSIAWAVAWGLLLETIAIYAPTGPIFGVYGNSPAIIIAYLGHVAYGLPLGYLVKHWEIGCSWMERINEPFKRGLAGALAIVLLSSLLAPAINVWWPREPATMTIEGKLLKPDYARIHISDTLRFLNSESEPKTVIVKSDGREFILEPGASEGCAFAAPGIYQVYVASASRSISSFALVEPIHEASLSRDSTTHNHE